MVNHGPFSSYTSFHRVVQAVSMVGSVFVAALMGSPAVKSSPLDLWGNIKIPRIERYETETLNNDDGWYKTGRSDGGAYSSLIGITIAGMNSSKCIDYTTRI